MTDAEQVQQALAELWDVVKCRCHEAYTGRGLHDPDCQCDSTDAVQTVADRIEALIAERDEAMQLLKTLSNMNGDLSRDLYKTKLLLAKAEAGLREIAAEASVPVHTWKNGINFKKMYEGRRKIAVERIDIARTALAEIKGENQDGQ